MHERTDKDVDADEKSRFEPYCRVEIEIDRKSLLFPYYVAIRYEGGESHCFGGASNSEVGSNIGDSLRQYESSILGRRVRDLEKAIGDAREDLLKSCCEYPSESFSRLMELVPEPKVCEP